MHAHPYPRLFANPSETVLVYEDEGKHQEIAFVTQYILSLWLSLLYPQASCSTITASAAMLYSPKSLAAFVSAVGIASNTALSISVPFVKSSKAASSDGEFQFQNNQDVIYIGTIKVLGKDFEVYIVFQNQMSCC